MILALLITTCGGSAVAAEVRSDAPRAGADPASIQAAQIALDGFSADLYRALSAGDGNVVLSPYSVATALAMVRAGAVGEIKDDATGTILFLGRVVDPTT